MTEIDKVGIKDIAMRIVNKLTSGKFLLTLIAGVTFFYAVRHKMLDPAAIASICTAVFMSYFGNKESNDRTIDNSGNGS